MIKSVQIANTYEGKIYKALIKIFNELRAEFVRKEFAEVLRQKGLAGAFEYLNNMSIRGVIESNLVNILGNAINDGGNEFYNEVPEEAKKDKFFTFFLLSSLTANQIEVYQKTVIDKIELNTLEALKARLLSDYSYNADFDKLARDIKNTIGLTPKQEKAVKNYETYLRNLDRVSLRRQLRDKRFDPTIERAIKDGKKLTEAQISKMVNRYRENFIKHRAKTLARTYGLSSVSLGQYTAGIQALKSDKIDKNKLRRFWQDMGDRRVRDAHRAVPFLNPEGVSLDGVFKTPLGPMRFPRDPKGVGENVYNCRCWVVFRTI